LGGNVDHAGHYIGYTQMRLFDSAWQNNLSSNIAYIRSKSGAQLAHPAARHTTSRANETMAPMENSLSTT
jgi:hypothetical protein